MQFPLICLCPWLQMLLVRVWVLNESDIVITPTTHPNTNNEPLFSHLLWKITTPTSISLRNLCASSPTFSHGSWWAAMSALTASNSYSWSCSLVTSSGGRCVCAPILQRVLDHVELTHCPPNWLKTSNPANISDYDYCSQMCDCDTMWQLWADAHTVELSYYKNGSVKSVNDIDTR